MVGLTGRFVDEAVAVDIESVPRVEVECGIAGTAQISGTMAAARPQPASTRSPPTPRPCRCRAVAMPRSCTAGSSWCGLGIQVEMATMSSTPSNPRTPRCTVPGQSSSTNVTSVVGVSERNTASRSGYVSGVLSSTTAYSSMVNLYRAAVSCGRFASRRGGRFAVVAHAGDGIRSPRTLSRINSARRRLH